MLKKILSFPSTMAVCATLAWSTVVCADDFYQGKTINLIVATSAGGDYDTRARLFARFFGRHIAGLPGIIVQNMPGGGGILAANYIHKLAARDGTVIGSLDQLAPLAQTFKEKGVEYDLLKGYYIGNTTSSPIVLAAWHSATVKTFDDALRNELIIGATGAGSANTQVPIMINALLGTRFKVVSGYPGGNELYLAMEKGEIEGRASQNLAGWRSQRPDWLRDGKINFLAQAGSRRHSDIPDVPLLRDYAKSDEDRAVLDLYFNTMEIARPFWVGPITPTERVKMLRDGFDATMRDPQFLEEATRMRVDVEPMSGAQIQSIVDRIVNAPLRIIEKAGAYAAAR